MHKAEFDILRKDGDQGNGSAYKQEDLLWLPLNIRNKLSTIVCGVKFEGV